jgi:hypothetical protein
MIEQNPEDCNRVDEYHPRTNIQLFTMFLSRKHISNIYQSLLVTEKPNQLIDLYHWTENKIKIKCRKC